MKISQAILLSIALLLLGCQTDSIELEQPHNNPSEEGGSKTVVTRQPTTVTELMTTITTEPMSIPAPPARSHHAMVYDNERQVVVMFGGLVIDSSSLRLKQDNSMWEYDGFSWKQIETATSPPARAYHSMAYDTARGVTVLYGGTGASGWLGDTTWEYDGNTWHEIDTIAYPYICEFPAMTYAANLQAIVFYGYKPETENTWLYTGHSWEQFPVKDPFATVDERVGRIFQNFLIYDSVREKLILQPIVSGERALTLELENNAWEVTIDSDIDGPFWGFRPLSALAYDSYRGVVVYFGGQKGESFGETWEYNGESWHRATPLQSPSSRYGHSLVYDEQRKVIVLFGGSSHGVLTQSLNDTWEYDGMTWVQR